MIDSAHQYPVHVLLSHENNVTYRIPPYQREYSWQKSQWEDLFDDLLEADSSHFLGTIITLNTTTDAVQGSVLEVIDGQQRLTTLTLLLAAAYSVMRANQDDLDEEQAHNLFSLGRQLVKQGEPRLHLQTQGHNRADYRQALRDASLDVEATWIAYYPSRRIAKCFQYFRDAISKLAVSRDISEIDAAAWILGAAKQAVIVKIEVATHADAFVLFASLNNRGMPLTPVDLIKNHVLAQAERGGSLQVGEAFALWSKMLASLGTSYAVHERFLRHYYNAFRKELPEVPNAPTATKSRLMRIYETFLDSNLREQLVRMVDASATYGRIAGTATPDEPTELDESLGRLARVQGAPSYVLVLWLMTNSARLDLSEAELAKIVDRLVAFFVRRNLTSQPPTYALPQLFMDLVATADEQSGDDVLESIGKVLQRVSSTDETFRERLEGPIYLENTDVTRFILTTLCEDEMTKETRVDLWQWEKGRFVFTIEHIAPQGGNLPSEWVVMLGGAEAAAKAQEEEVHRLGNLTLTAFNSTLSNKSFASKRDRMDSNNRHIGYKNGLALNAELATRTEWTVAGIEERTSLLVDKVMKRFPI